MSLFSKILCFLILLLFVKANKLKAQEKVEKQKKKSSSSEILEKEPNHTIEEITQELQVGQNFVGSLKTKADHDGFILNIPRKMVCSFKFSFQEKQNIQIKIGSFLSCSLLRSKTFEQRMYQIPQGKHLILLTPKQKTKPGPYSFEIHENTDFIGKEIEPNDQPTSPFQLQLSQKIAGEISGTMDYQDCFKVEITSPGIFEIFFAGKRNIEVKKPFIALIDISPQTGRPIYKYRCNLKEKESYSFYPVLNSGKYIIKVSFKFRQLQIGDSYQFELKPFRQNKPNSKEIEAAKKAIKKGEEWLIKTKKKKKKKETSAEIASAALKIMALCEGEKTKEKEEVIQKELLLLEKKFEKDKKALWHDKPIYAIKDEVYLHSIIVLALAEIATRGNKKAKELCEKAVPYLLASQLTKNRISEWGGPYEKKLYYGGWRYKSISKDSDISIAGWCLLALFAADVAEIETPGIESALKSGFGFINICGHSEGFSYKPGKRNFANIRNSIGAFISVFFELNNKSLAAALIDIDRHFCSGTQVDTGGDYPYYYWYYATRLNFFRGGKTWDNWRTIMILQLLRNQELDGSWKGIRHESRLTDFYSTSFAIMILHLCLNNPPAYFGKEIQGF